ncbi:MAG: hypothetical protein ACJ79H_18930 [Myxococcales bacterium]
MDHQRSLLAFAAAALLGSAARGEEFAPIKASESVTYPLPPVPFPAVPDGKWTETEDSPALRVSRAWVKLGQAAGVERSEATHRLHQAWKSEVAKSGPGSRAAQTAHARFLAAYKKDLDQARAIYEGVLRDVDALDGENGGNATGGGGGGDAAAGGLAREAEEQIRAADRDERLTNSACFLSPDTCQQNDPSDKALQDEISSLINGTLVAGGPDGGLSVYSLRRKASLLALRARVMAAVTQRAAARLATDVATQQDGQGSPRSLPSPVAQVSTASARRSAPAADPYR